MVATPKDVLEQVLASDNLPTLPTVASKLITLTGREDTTLGDIAQLVSQDMALSSKILKVANSAFYSFPQQISSIHQAVSILGTNAVRSLVLSFSFLSLKGGREDVFDFRAFWEQSLARAVAAKLIMEQLDGGNAEDVFVSGLLQNLGQLVFAVTLPEAFRQVLEAKPGLERPIVEIEREVIGADHAYVGYELTRRWAFPDLLSLPVLHHHEPDQYPGDDPALAQAIQVVYLSDLLTQILYSETPESYHEAFRKESKRLLGLEVLCINTILQEIHNQINATADYFGFKMEPARSVEEILQEANLRLSLLNLSYEEINRELIATKMELERLTKELKEKNRLLENLANIDGLTEVHNHRYFQEFLEKEINRSIRNENALSLLLLDIDHFKRFNDTYGHQTGDFILKELCRVLKQELREYDLLARYGGEEFVVVLPETDGEEAMVVGEKLRRAVDDYTFDDGDHTYHVTVSIGVASARPLDRSFQKNDLIGRADQALYEAKAKGRNRVELFTPKKKKKKWYKL